MREDLHLEDQLFKELSDLALGSKLSFNMVRLERAYRFAQKAHKGQFRMSGVPYVCHPLETAKMLAQVGADENTVVAGLLHDVPEDTVYNVQDVTKRFGKEVGSLVDALTKLSKLSYKYSMDERQVEALRKMFLQTANDSRVVLVKLADRLHNMQTIQYLRPEKQQRIAKETLEIYAPLANLYGIHLLQKQLEDLSFKVLQPEEFARIQAFVRDHEKVRSKFIEDTLKLLKKALHRAGIQARLEGRPKHFYSIYQKMVREQKNLQDIYDYFAIRILTEKESDSYQALGVAHDLFKPTPGRVKDYIAIPKPNGYQSLHTTVVGLRGELTEIQIRTEDMHKNAEYGIAAHLHYKNEGRAFFLEGIALLKRYKNPDLFVKGLREDVLQRRIFVFSPKGEVINLPEGASCLDYLFAANLPLNKSVLRVVVNNRVYSLTGVLQSGDRIEVIYSQQESDGPERWWLDHVKTTKAQEHIRAFFSKQSFDTKVALGEHLLQQEMDRENRGLVYQIPHSKASALAQQFGVKAFSNVLAKIGEGTLSTPEVYKALFPRLHSGWHEWLFDTFLTLKRWLNIGSEEGSYRIRMRIESWDRVGLLKELIEPFYKLGLPIMYWKGHSLPYRKRDLEMKKHREGGIPPDSFGYSVDIVEVKVETHEQLLRLFDYIQKVPGVMQVERIFKRKQMAFAIAAFLGFLYFILLPLIIEVLLEGPFLQSKGLRNPLIYFGFASLFILLFWLRTLTNKTFPHFEETKFFWPLAFTLTSFAIVSVFVNNAVYGLELHIPSMTAVSIFIFLWLLWTYNRHQKRRKIQLQSMKRAVDSSLKNS